MPIFEREMDRYIVVKIKHLTDAHHAALDDFLADRGIDTIKSVVVEADWPIYDQAWALVEDQWVSDITEEQPQ